MGNSYREEEKPAERLRRRQEEAQHVMCYPRSQVKEKMSERMEWSAAPEGTC